MALSGSVVTYSSESGLKNREWFPRPASVSGDARPISAALSVGTGGSVEAYVNSRKGGAMASASDCAFRVSRRRSWGSPLLT